MGSVKMKRACFCAVFFAFLFMPAVVLAQPGGGQPDIVGDMDTDGDGKVSKAEWNRNENVFKEYDKNGDGFIDSEEKPGGIPTFALLDIDGDGKVTKEEFPGPDNIFTEFDRDGNGYLVESEAAPPGAGGGAPGGAPPSGGMPGGTGEAPPGQ